MLQDLRRWQSVRQLVHQSHVQLPQGARLRLRRRAGVPLAFVYRIVHFPAGEHEDLTTIWLWSDGAGVFSHETAAHAA
jgi:hypothetical protein